MSSLFPIALQLQTDLKSLCDRNAPVTAFPDAADLWVRCGGMDSRVHNLVRLARDLTHLEFRPDGEPNTDHIPGHAIPFICTDTDGRMIMSRGLDGQLGFAMVCASIRNLQYTKTRGFNATAAVENIRSVLPRSGRGSRIAQQAFRTAVSHLQAAFDPWNSTYGTAGNVAQAIRALEVLWNILTATENDYLHDLVERASMQRLAADWNGDIDPGEDDTGLAI